MFTGLPLMKDLANCQRILLAGAGGGFDIFQGLPLYHALKAEGKEVLLANLSFSPLAHSDGEKLAPALYKVTSKTNGHESYFPEMYLARWFKEKLAEEVPVYCIERTGYLPVANAYEKLLELFSPDALILIDGGTDSLMRGDEVSLATPQEDIVSLGAAAALGLDKSYLVCIGFGVDAYHGICHFQYLEGVAEIIKEGGFLGAWSLMKESKEFELFKEALDYTNERMVRHPSIVGTSIKAAVEGEYGDYHATFRTEGSTLWINPLMSLFWAFRLEAVTKRIMYLDLIKETMRYEEVCRIIDGFRVRTKCKKWQDLPL